MNNPKKKKYFLDTEFIESGRHKPIQLISIGIVSESGEKYYAISSEFNLEDASDWVKRNVIEKLETNLVRKNVFDIGSEIIHFIKAEENSPEFWGYYCDYDWVVLCQIFGTMICLPPGFPMYCNDLKQLCNSLGNPKLKKQDINEHNALNDALWLKDQYYTLLGEKLNE